MSGATYKAMEFGGTTIESLSVCAGFLSMFLIKANVLFMSYNCYNCNIFLMLY